MKKVLFCFLIVLGVTACQKQIVPLPIPTPPVTFIPAIDEPEDSIICTPFLQRLLLQLDRTHSDSAFLQLPCAYNGENSTEKYPLLIFFNGVFEGSNYGGLKKMKKLGPPKFMVDSLRYSFIVNGKTENFIVVCPQSENGFRGPLSTNQVIDLMIAKYRVDTNRIYLTGLSAGANSVLRYLTHKPEYAARIAAAVPMSTTHLDSTHRSHLNYISNAGVPLYWFCGKDDKKYLKVNQAYVKTLEQLSPGLVQFKLYKGAHKSWNPMYDISHKYYNPNIYEWMLQFSK